MSYGSDWYFNQSANTLKVSVETVKNYCKEHNYLPSIFYELIIDRKVVSRNSTIHINKRK